MCGIAGYWGKTPLEPERLQQASKVLQHRGPDDSGIYQHQHPRHCVALVHRRLSILDLDPRSAQPFRLGHQVLSYNGEIYNYVEIRQELISLGHVFRTTGDTEVLAVRLREESLAASMGLRSPVCGLLPGMMNRPDDFCCQEIVLVKSHCIFGILQMDCSLRQRSKA